MKNSKYLKKIPQKSINSLVYLYDQNKHKLVIEKCIELIIQFPDEVIILNIFGAACLNMGKFKDR